MQLHSAPVVRAIFLCVFVTACTRDPANLSSFSSDGCSLFPDRSAISPADWCTCCFEHDIAYWRGGTAEQREEADASLRDCIVAKTGNEPLAEAMYEGVRFGGSPYFLNWYRWGYGWSFDRRYEPLTPEESRLADRLLDTYVTGNPAEVCPVG